MPFRSLGDWRFIADVAWVPVGRGTWSPAPIDDPWTCGRVMWQHTWGPDRPPRVRVVVTTVILANENHGRPVHDAGRARLDVGDYGSSSHFRR